MVLALAAALFAGGWLAQAEPVKTAPVELLPNGDFSKATKDPAWPDDWHRGGGVTRQQEKGTAFIHFAGDASGKPMKLAAGLKIPASPEIAALKVTVCYRTVGGKGGGDLQVSFRFNDRVQIRFAPEPAALVLHPQAAEWTTATDVVAVPAHAATLSLTIQADVAPGGSVDISKVSVVNAPAPSSPAISTDKSPDIAGIKDAPLPIRRDGVHTIIGEGVPAVWFVGPYVDVFGHDYIMGINHLVRDARDAGTPIAIGVTPNLDEVSLKDAARTIYVFSYKNINYPLPADARGLIFINTWLTPAVEWPPSRAGKHDAVVIGAAMLGNNGDGLATNKARWMQIQKDDPALTLTVLEGKGYYLDNKVWREPVLKLVLEKKAERK